MKKKFFFQKKAYIKIFSLQVLFGTGKTSSAMYPFTKQLINLFSNDKTKKLGMLILDVKGNYSEKVKNFCKDSNRLDDLIVIDLSGKYKYNPLHKPNLKPSVLANRLKSILLLFSPNNSESYWLDEVEIAFSHAITIIRLYNDGYVTFDELHKIITNPLYLEEKIPKLRKCFMNHELSKEDCYNLLSSLNYFENEFNKLDERTVSILRSEAARITNLFVSDYNAKNVFCSSKESLNFAGFEDVLKSGKIVVLNMNISEYKNLSKLIAAYLKLDFQTEIMQNLATKKYNRSVCFISDEYHEYVTANDSEFYAQSREAKCISIVATQSYTSLLNTLKNDANVKVIVQNLVNKFWFRTDDIYTIEDAQKQIGKEEKEHTSQTISENSKLSTYNYLLNKFNSQDSNISESINTYSQFDFKYDTNFFTQELEVFTCLGFLSDGNKILKPQKLKMLPYFKGG